MHELVELDPAILIARHDHRVVDLDQILMLQCEHLVAHLLGLLLAVEPASLRPPLTAICAERAAAPYFVPAPVSPSVRVFGWDGPWSNSASDVRTDGRRA
jgi:hypothetical protein